MESLIQKLLPDDLADDVRRNVKLLANSVIEELHLVSREEFELQQKMLHKLSEELEELTKRIEAQQRDR